MAGVDKLILICRNMEKQFLGDTREHGRARGGYNSVLDLRQTHHNLPLILHCDGRHNGMHKIELVDVARLGLSSTKRILGTVLPHLSDARIFRVDFCADIPGIGVWELAENIYVSRSQNFRIYNSRHGVSFYLKISADRTILLYDKAKQLAAKHDPLAQSFRSGKLLTRVEVQLKGRGVPYKKIRHLHRYVRLDLLDQFEFRRLRRLMDDSRPQHRLAASGLRRLIHRYGLHAVKKQFSSAHWVYIERTLLEALDGDEVPDIALHLKRSIQDWLERRVRFPRLPESESDE